MAYLHCHSCDWSQDDFWSEGGWTPLHEDIIAWYRKLLFQGTMNVDRPGGCVDVDTRELVASYLETKAIGIRNMVWKTEEDWKVARDTAVCPNCGAQDFDID